MNTTPMSTGHPDAGAYYANLYQEQRLRADTAEAEVERLEDEFDTLENTNTTIKLKLAAAEQRIASGIAYVQRLVNCSKNQDSVATGYLSDILAALNPNPEAGSHE